MYCCMLKTCVEWHVQLVITLGHAGNVQGICRGDAQVCAGAVPFCCEDCPRQRDQGRRANYQGTCCWGMPNLVLGIVCLRTKNQSPLSQVTLLTAAMLVLLSAVVVLYCKVLDLEQQVDALLRAPQGARGK